MKLELRSVRLKNCGPLDDVKIDFFDASGKTLPVCVIGGANGSGKTTILETTVGLMLNLRQDVAKDIKALHHKLQSPDITYIQLDWLLDDHFFSVTYGEFPPDVRFPYLRDDLSIPRPLGNSPIVKYQGYSPRIDKLWSFFEKIQYPGEIREMIDNIASQPIPSIIYLPHTRRIDPVGGKQVHKETDNFKFIYYLENVKTYEGSLNSYLIWLEYSDAERYSKIQQFLNDLDFDGKTFRVDRKSLSVMVKTKSGAEHPLHQLSSGEQNLLIILIELYRKLTPGSIVLIDEIENSLHPAFQHRLAQGLLKLQKEIPYQLIVTTHAPAFVEIFGAENTRLLTAF